MKTLLTFLMRKRDIPRLSFIHSGPEALSFPQHHQVGLSRYRQNKPPGPDTPPLPSALPKPEPTSSHLFCVASHGRRCIPALTGVQCQAPRDSLCAQRPPSYSHWAGQSHPTHPGAWPSPQNHSEGPGALCGLHGCTLGNCE